MYKLSGIINCSLAFLFVLVSMILTVVPISQEIALELIQGFLLTTIMCGSIGFGSLMK